MLDGVLRGVLRLQGWTIDSRSGPLLLSEEEADEWVRCPAFRFLSPADLSAAVAAAAQAAEAVEAVQAVTGTASVRPAQPSLSLVPLLQGLARVTDWAPWYVDAREAERRWREGRSGSTGDSAAAGSATGTVFYNPPGLRSVSGMYRSFRVSLRLHLRPGPHPDPHEGAGDPGAGPGEAGDAPVGELDPQFELEPRFERELITPAEEGLPWAPFLPRDLRTTEDDHGDVTFPRVFPGSAADELARLSSTLAAVFPFHASDIARFVLTGAAPAYWPVRVTTYDTCGSAAPAAALEEVFLARARSGDPVRGYVQVTAEPWVSAETVQRYYRHYQQEAAGKAGDKAGDKGGEGTGGLFRLPAVRFADGLAWAARQYRQAKSERVSWRRTYEAVSKGTGTSTSGDLGAAAAPLEGDYSSFVKGLKRAAAILDLPQNLSRMVDRIRPGR